MSRTDTPEQDEDFETVFRKTVTEMEAEAREAGTNLTEVCRETGVSRATPDRWKRRAPKTIRNVAQMQRAIRARKNESACGDD